MKLKDFFTILHRLKSNVRMQDRYDIYFDVHSCEIKNILRFQAECYICYLKLNKKLDISFEEFLFTVFWDRERLYLYNEKLLSLLSEIESNEKLKERMSCLKIHNNTFTLTEYYIDRLHHTELNFLYGYQVFHAFRKYKNKRIPYYMENVVDKTGITYNMDELKLRNSINGIYKALESDSLVHGEKEIKMLHSNLHTTSIIWDADVNGPKFSKHIDRIGEQCYADLKLKYNDTKEHWINNPRFETDYSIRSVLYTLLVGLNLFATVFLYFTWGGFFFSLRTGIWDNMMFAQNCIDALPLSFITIPLGAFHALWLFPTIMDYIIWPSPFSRIEEMEDLKNYDIDKTINEDKVIVKRNIAMSFVWDLLDVTLFNKHKEK